MNQKPSQLRSALSRSHAPASRSGTLTSSTAPAIATLPGGSADGSAWQPAPAGAAALQPASPIQTYRLPLGDLDRTFCVLAPGADIGEHVEDDEVGKRGRRLLADRTETAGGQGALGRLAKHRVLG